MKGRERGKDREKERRRDRRRHKERERPRKRGRKIQQGKEIREKYEDKDRKALLTPSQNSGLVLPCQTQQIRREARFDNPLRNNP